MKQLQAKGYTFFYHSSKGEVHVQKDGPGQPGYSLSAEALIELVAELARSEWIDRPLRECWLIKALGQMTAREVLGFPPEKAP